MFLGSGKNEDHKARRLLKRLQKRIEGIGGEHVHLVDDEHLVLARLGRDAHLFNEFADVVNRVVGSGIEFMDTKRTSLVEGSARFALPTWVAMFIEVLAVDGLCKDAGAGGLSHATRPTEEIGMSQAVGENGILERSGQRPLSHNGVKGHRSVFSCRNNVLLFHCNTLILLHNLGKDTK